MRSSSVTKLHPRSGQAAVETMMMAWIIAVILVSMYHLFTVTWATSNAHMRAREAALHGDAYLSGVRTTYTRSVRSPFLPSVGNYRKAEPGTSINFQGLAWDTTRDDLIGSQAVSVSVSISE